MKKVGFAAFLLTTISPAAVLAADIGEPPVIYPPIIEEPVTYHDEDQGMGAGWYLRGDVGYALHDLRGIDYAVNGGSNVFTKHELKSSFSVGGGVGYHISKRVRADLTLDYLAKSNFHGHTVGDCAAAAGTGPDCTSTDIASFTAWSLMANAYVDLFTYGRVSGYVGAGLGATRIKWADLHNTACESADLSNCDPTVVHDGAYGWRATAALMAGASIKLNCALAADVNYRYRYMAGGQMFKLASGAGPGHTDAIHSHEGRAGLRYSFGGCEDYIPPYEPPTLPPVYK